MCSLAQGAWGLKTNWGSRRIVCQKHSLIHASCFTLRLTVQWTRALVLSHLPLLCYCRPLLRTQTCCPRIHLSTVKIHGKMVLLRNFTLSQTKRRILAREVRFCVDIRIVTTRCVGFGIFPCVWTTSLKKGCVCGYKCEAQQEVENKAVRKDQLLYWRRLHNWVVYLKILIQESLFFVSLENWERTTPSNYPKAPGTKLQFHREVLSKSVHLMSNHAFCRDSGLPHDTRNTMGTSGNVFERLPVREGLPSALFENLKNLASSSRELRPDISGNTLVPERETRREPQNSSIPVPR